MLKKVGNDFLTYNTELRNAKLASLQEVGEYFLSFNKNKEIFLLKRRNKKIM